MTAFSYSSGNPADLTAGGGAEMIDIQGPLNDLRSFLNGGTLDETNVPNLSAAFTTYKKLFRAAALQHTTGAGTYGMFVAGTISANSGVNNNVHFYVFQLDPSLFNANTRTTKLQLRLAVTTNALGPAITYTAGLYPVTAFSGASGTPPIVGTVGTVVTGSTAAVASPGAAARTTANSADFNFPSAGPYMLAFTTSGTPTANAQADLEAQLVMRQV